MNILNRSQSQLIGLIVMIAGLMLALVFGGDVGFTLGPLAGMAYIGGFVIAFIGAYFLFLYGRPKHQKDEQA